MQITRKCHFKMGAFLMLTAVILGAFGAHGLEKIAREVKHLTTFKTGVTYHYYHALGFFILGLLQEFIHPKAQSKLFWLFSLGILFFSGNAYLYGLTGLKTFGLLMPIGGLLFVGGWLLLLFSFKKD